MNRSDRRRFVLEEIEPRILYSSDVAPLLADAAALRPVPEVRVLDASGEFVLEPTQAQSVRHHEVVFVDTAVPDCRKLVDDILAQSGPQRQLDLVMIDAHTDGIEKIGATLANMKDVSAVHIIGHGADGEIDLGATTLNFDSLLSHATQIKAWKQALAPGADVLVYGCDVAERADGRALIDALGRLTGADVAASEDLTGAAAKGGDWDLEYRTGKIQTLLAVSAAEQRAWTGLLDAAGVQAGADPASTSSAPPTPGGSAASPQVQAAATPLVFEQNIGQADASVDYLARGSGYTVALTGGNAILALADGTASSVVRLDVVGDNPNATATAENALASKSNYLIGDQQQWLTNIANYGGVVYHDVYQGIDLRYHGNQQQLEYDFIVKAGADTHSIRLDFSGASGVSVAQNGDLVLTLDNAGHTISFKAPVAYQDGPSGREAVISRYVLNDDGTVGFETGPYDATRELVIDPVLSYGTYYGGTGSDVANGVAVDAAGNVYLAGYSPSNGLLGGLLGGLGGGGREVFVAKFSPNLGSLVYSTYVGGKKDDIGTAIAVDAVGNAYVTGYTQSTDFPTVSAYDSARAGTGATSTDAFVFKLNADGSTLTYSTYLGGSGNADEGWAIAVDASGSAYVAGVANSSDFPVTLGAADSSYGGSSDGFVTKLSANGNSLVYSTFIGGAGTDIGYGIAVDPSGNAVVVGETASSDFSTTANAFQKTYSLGTVISAGDAFVTELNSSGTGFTYSAYLGGSDVDVAFNVTLDSAGKIYLTGQTSSSNFPATLGALRTTLSGGTDAFVAIIDPSASGSASLAYSTYLGGSNSGDAGLGVGVDTGGRVYVGGQTNSSDLPVTAGAFKTTNTSGNADAFFVLINPVGSGSGDLLYGSYFGGAGSDFADNATYSNGRFYLVGDTTSSSGIATSSSYDTVESGGTDGFAAVFTIPPTVSATSGSLVYTENAGALPLDSGLIVSDPGFARLAGATVQITGNYVNGEDVLAFNNANTWGITGTWDATAGTLVLAGSSSVANYQTALRSVTYQDTSEKPNTASRSVTITASDGVFVSSPATRSIAVTSVNDAPVNNAPGTQSTLEDSPLVFSSASGNAIWISDVDADTGAEQVSLSVDAGQLTLAQTTGLTFVTGNGTGNQTITFTGTLAAINAALDGLRFDPAANFNGAANLQIVTNDQGNTGQGGPLTATSNVGIDVVAVNDPPSNSVPGPQLTPQNTPLIFSSGNGNAIGVSDVDAAAGQLQITLTASNGTLTLGSVAGLTSVSGQGTSVVALTGTLVNLNGALNGLAFAPTTSFSGGATLQMVANDLGNTGLGGALTVTSTVAIMVSPDVAPSIAMSGASLTYVEKNPATPIDTGLIVTDPDSPSLDHAVVSVAAGYVNGEDVLVFNNANSWGITGAWDAATGTLTLSGAATVANYQSALRSVSYQNLSSNPSTANRTVTFVANDGIADGAAVSETIAVTAVDDPPANAVPAAQSTSEDTAIVFSAANGNGIKVGDPDAGGNSIQVTLSTSNGMLTLAQTSGLTIGSGSNGSGSMTLSGTIVDINAALNGLRFDPAPDYDGAATLQIVSDDQGNSGTGGPRSATDSVAINVVPVNDAPIGTANTISMQEDTPYAFSAADFGFADPNDSPANNLLAVEVTTLPGVGSLTDNGVAVTAGQFVSAADIAAGRLIFTPTANANGSGYDAFSFQVQDDGGSANGGVNTDSTARTMTIDVTPVDDAPVNVVPPTQSTGQNMSLVFSSAGGNSILVDDIDAGGSPVQVTLSVTNGTLTLSGIAGLSFTTGTGAGDVTVGFSGTLAAINAALDGLTYAPTSGYAGSAGLAIVTDDLGNTGSGGPLTAIGSVGITVTAINHAPQGSDGTVTALEDTPYVFTANDFGFSDPNDSPPNNLLAVEITTLPVAGTFIDNGAAVTAGQLVSLADIVGGKLVFSPSANANGVGYASFSFQVQDDGGTAGGGVDLDPTARTMSIDVTSVNNAPQGSNNTVTTLEDTAYTFGTLDFGFSDAADSPANSLLAVEISTLPGAGTLSDNGAAVSAGQFVSVTDIASGKLKFMPAANANGAGYADFTFQVQDNGGTAGGGVDTDPVARTMSIDVTAVNDAPSGADKTVSTLEDTAYTFATANFGFTDSVDSPSNNLLAVKVTTLPTAGVLTDNGVAVVAGQFVSVTDIASNGLQFAPAPNANGPAYTSFTFQVQDDGGTGSGGVDTDPTAHTFTIDVTPVNDAPQVAANNGISLTPGSSATIGSATLATSDPDNSAGQLVYTVSALPAKGKLMLGSTAVALNGTFTQADIDSGLLSYKQTTAAAGNYSFTFTVADGAGGTVGPATFGITVATPPPVTVTPPPPPPPVTSPPTTTPSTPTPTTSPPVSAPTSTPTSTPSGGGSTSSQPSTPSGGGSQPAAEVPEEVGAPVAAAPPQQQAQSNAAQRTAPSAAVAANATATGVSLNKLKFEGGSATTAGPMQFAATMPIGETQTLSLGPLAPLSAASTEAHSFAVAKSTLGNSHWVEELNRMRDSAGTEVHTAQRVVVSSVAVTGGLSVGYVIWLLRGGLLLSSLLSSLPAWQVVDPMPILERSRRTDEDGESGEDGDDPLESLFNRARAAVGLSQRPPVPDDPEPDIEPEDAVEASI